MHKMKFKNSNKAHEKGSKRNVWRGGRMMRGGRERGRWNGQKTNTNTNTHATKNKNERKN